MTDSAAIIATLRAIEERITDLADGLRDPEGQAQQAMHDILRTYGLSAQISEVSHMQHDQILALTEAIVMYHGRVVEHTKLICILAADVRQIIIMLHDLSNGQGIDLTEQAFAARALVQEAAEQQLAELERQAQTARDLLVKAQQAAKALIDRERDAARDAD